MKGKHRWNGPLIPAATAMVLLGVCDSATADSFGVRLAAGVADHHVHELGLGLVAIGASSAR